MTQRGVISPRQAAETQACFKWYSMLHPTPSCNSSFSVFASDTGDTSPQDKQRDLNSALSAESWNSGYIPRELWRGLCRMSVCSYRDGMGEEPEQSPAQGGASEWV